MIKIWIVELGTLRFFKFDSVDRIEPHMTEENGYFGTAEDAIEFSRARDHERMDLVHDYLRQLHGVDE